VTDGYGTGGCTDGAIESLERARDIFTRFQLPDEHGAVTSLQAQILHDGGRYKEAVEKMDIVRGGLDVDVDVDVAAGEGGEEGRSQSLWSISLLQAKSHWYAGGFEVAEGLAGEAYALFRTIEMNRDETVDSEEGKPSITSTHGTTPGLRMGCSMNALALSKLAALDISDERLMGLYRRNHNDTTTDTNDITSDTDRSWSNTLRESDEIEDMLGMASRVLTEDYRSMKETATTHDATNSINTTSTTVVKLALAGAASYCNQGVAQLFYLTAKRRLMGRSLSTDSAMYTWTTAIEVLDDLDLYLDTTSSHHDDNHDRQHFIAMAKSIRARVYCNMSWTILFFDSSTTNIDINDNDDNATKQMPINEDRLKDASEHAGSALKLYEALSADDASKSSAVKPSMGRALGLVASCYARAGSSVTAEGLFQTAIDYCAGGGDGDGDRSGCSMARMDARSCLLCYSELCQNWENRGVDAKKNAGRALEMDRSLRREDTGGNDGTREGNGDGWQGKSAIYSGLWFFSIGDF